jgi:hypothetical protein
VVDDEGLVLWEGEPLALAGAKQAVFCDVGRVVDEPAERSRVAARTGAVAVDMESAALAASGRLVGVVRAIVDTPEARAGRLAFAVKPDGRTDLLMAIRVFAADPLTSIRMARRARGAFASLARAAAALSP